MVSEEQFAAWYEEYLPKIFGFISRRVCDRAEAEDIVSNIFLKAANNISKFNPDKSSFKTWIYTIAANTLIDYFRTRKVNADIEEAHNIATAAENPQEAASRQMQRGVVHKAIASLPKRHQRVIMLKYFGDLSSDEICQTLGITPNNASVMIHRALGAFESAYNRFIS